MAPAVGYSRTVTASNVLDAGLVSDWSLLEAQAAAGTNIDLIVKGTIDQQRRGLLYQPGANNYRLDATNAGTLTRAQLVAKIQAGDTLTVMGVPPGSGQRMGMDRDLNGVLDFDEAPPQLRIALVSDRTVINWPSRPSGFRLEQTDSLLAPTWSDDTNAVETVDQFHFVTNTTETTTRFFRLREE